jgi:hypothetical protein
MEAESIASSEGLMPEVVGEVTEPESSYSSVSITGFALSIPTRMDIKDIFMVSFVPSVVNTDDERLEIRVKDEFKVKPFASRVDFMMNFLDAVMKQYRLNQSYMLDPGSVIETRFHERMVKVIKPSAMPYDFMSLVEQRKSTNIVSDYSSVFSNLGLKNPSLMTSDALTNAVKYAASYSFPLTEVAYESHLRWQLYYEQFHANPRVYYNYFILQNTSNWVMDETDELFTLDQRNLLAIFDPEAELLDLAITQSIDVRRYFLDVIRSQVQGEMKFQYTPVRQTFQELLGTLSVSRQTFSRASMISDAVLMSDLDMTIKNLVSTLLAGQFCKMTWHPGSIEEFDMVKLIDAIACTMVVPYLAMDERSWRRVHNYIYNHLFVNNARAVFDQVKDENMDDESPVLDIIGDDAVKSFFARTAEGGFFPNSVLIGGVAEYNAANYAVPYRERTDLDFGRYGYVGFASVNDENTRAKFTLLPNLTRYIRTKARFRRFDMGKSFSEVLEVILEKFREKQATWTRFCELMNRELKVLNGHPATFPILSNRYLMHPTFYTNMQVGSAFSLLMGLRVEMVVESPPNYQRVMDEVGMRHTFNMEIREMKLIRNMIKQVRDKVPYMPETVSENDVIEMAVEKTVTVSPIGKILMGESDIRRDLFDELINTAATSFSLPSPTAIVERIADKPCYFGFVQEIIINPVRAQRISYEHEKYTTEFYSNALAILPIAEVLGGESGIDAWLAGQGLTSEDPFQMDYRTFLRGASGPFNGLLFRDDLIVYNLPTPIIESESSLNPTPGTVLESLRKGVFPALTRVRRFITDLRAYEAEYFHRVLFATRGRTYDLYATVNDWITNNNIYSNDPVPVKITDMSVEVLELRTEISLMPLPRARRIVGGALRTF